MKKNYRITLDIEVDINEKVEIPQEEDNSSTGEFSKVLHAFMQRKSRRDRELLANGR